VATTESTGTRPETVFSTFFNKERSIFQIWRDIEQYKYKVKTKD
jgi:hypothetical protein